MACPRHHQESCQKLTTKLQPAHVILITYLCISVLVEGRTSLQMSRRGQERSMVWLYPPLGLLASKTKVEDTQFAASQTPSPSCPGTCPSFHAFCSVHLPQPLHNILLTCGLSWQTSSYDLPMPTMSPVTDTGNCKCYDCCDMPTPSPRPLTEADCQKSNQAGFSLITYLFTDVPVEGETTIQLSSREQEGSMVWSCPPLGLWPSMMKEENTQSVASHPLLPRPCPSFLCPFPCPLTSASAHNPALLWHELAKGAAVLMIFLIRPCCQCLCDTGN